MATIFSWGRVSAEQDLITYDSPQKIITNFTDSTNSLIFGKGRSYGDVGLNSGGKLWNTSFLSRFISFSSKTGVLECEAGVTLQDIQRTLSPQGWLLPVTPGTQIVTVGGAIANDVHGKNHHVYGTFGEHVLSFRLLRTTGEIIDCSKSKNSDWFYATLGGIGLTGFILDVKLQMKLARSLWIESETIPYFSLKEFFELSEQSVISWEHTVSWIDCSKGDVIKGLFIRGREFLGEGKTRILKADKYFPFNPSFSLVNKTTLPFLNFAYFYSNILKQARTVQHYETFFYPLDSLHNWNKMYGTKGFYQYQCVIPTQNAFEATSAMLKLIKKSGEGSFLAVLKTFGKCSSGGLLSFPIEGVTLALDFPNHGETTLKLFSELDRIVFEAGGRLYLAKDARMPRFMFEAGYPNFADFLYFKDRGISSNMSRRLLGE